MRPCAVGSSGAVVMLGAQRSDLPAGMEAIPNRRDPKSPLFSLLFLKQEPSASSDSPGGPG